MVAGLRVFEPYWEVVGLREGRGGGAGCGGFWGVGELPWWQRSRQQSQFRNQLVLLRKAFGGTEGERGGF